MAETPKIQRYVNLPAIGKKVPLGAYVAAIKTAKANPTQTFKTGLTCWYSCSGADIVNQFTDGMMDRISQGISYSARGWHDQASIPSGLRRGGKNRMALGHR